MSFDLTLEGYVQILFIHEDATASLIAVYFEPISLVAFSAVRLLEICSSEPKDLQESNRPIEEQERCESFERL